MVQNECFYGPSTFCENCMPGGGDLALKLGKKGSVFFNCHYFISKLISDFDFWNLDRHE